MAAGAPGVARGRRRRCAAARTGRRGAAHAAVARGAVRGRRTSWRVDDAGDGRPGRRCRASSGRPRSASPTSRRAGAARSAARSSTPTRCSSTAAWTSAPPSSPPAERRGVPHHLLDVLDVTRRGERRRLPAARPGGGRRDRRARGRVPLLVGGSGLYVRAVARRARVPRHRPALRARLEAELGRARARRRCTRGSRERRPGGRRGDPAQQRPPDRAGAGGGRADRPPYARDAAQPPRTLDPTPIRWVGSDCAARPARRARSPRGSTGCGRPGWSTRCAALRARRPARGADGVPCAGLRPGAATARRRARRGHRPPAGGRRHPPARPAAGVLVPPRPRGALARLRRPGTCSASALAAVAASAALGCVGRGGGAGSRRAVAGGIGLRHGV